MDDEHKVYKIYLNLTKSAARSHGYECTGVCSWIINTSLGKYFQRGSPAEISTITCTLVGSSSDHPGVPGDINVASKCQ